MIDQLIEVTTLAAIGWVACEFLSYGWQRVSKERKAAKRFHQSVAEETCPTYIQCDQVQESVLEPQEAIQPDPVQQACDQLAEAYADVVVEFKRPTAKQPTDADLVAWAKANKFPGSGKWSKSRKLSKPVRSQILSLMQQAV